MADAGDRDPFPRYQPQLALLVPSPPTGAGWVHEIKHDGYRIGLAIRTAAKKRTVTLLSRRSLNWTAHFSLVAKAAATLPVAEVLLDGEIVIQLPDGRDDFHALQDGAAGKDPRLVYFAFDLLYLDGRSLLRLPLLERKKRLAHILRDNPDRIRYSDHFDGDGTSFFSAARGAGVEGIVSKRASASYRPGSRSADWQKTKCVQRQEFVVGGYLKSDATPLAAIHVGYYHRDGTFRFAGKVGTGFQTVEGALLRQLELLTQPTCPFAEHYRPRGRDFREAYWLTPTVVVEIEFLSWTPDSHLRHPSYKAQRHDIDPRSVRRELAAK